MDHRKNLFRIENLLANWDEKLPELFISLVNAVALAENETELRQAVAILSENKDFKRLFAYGYGSSHLWLKQRLITDSKRSEYLPSRSGAIRPLLFTVSFRRHKK